MDEVIVVHFLGVDDVTVLLLAQVGGVDAVGAQELPVGHAEGLANGLCYELRLWGKSSSRRGNYSTQRRIIHDGKRTVVSMNMQQKERFFLLNSNNQELYE